MTLQMASLRATLRETVSHLSLDEMTDLANGSLLPRETARMDEHLTTCTACTAQVQELREMVRPNLVAKAERPRFTEWMGAFFTLPRMMVASAMVLVIAVLSGWLLLRHHVAELPVASVSRPTSSPSEPGKTQTQMTAQSSGPVGEKTLPSGETGTSKGVKVPSSILAVALMPGIARGEDTERSVHLPVQLDTLLLTLNSRAQLTPGRYRVSLTDDAGHNVWRTEVVYRKLADAVVVRVPAKLLMGGQYVLQLAAVEDSGASENLDEYALEIVR
jgi:hypothetical protein